MINKMTFLKKAMILTVVGTMTILSVGCGNTDTPEISEVETETSEVVSEITLRYADSQPVGYPSVEAAEEFAKIVSEKTNGRIKIEIYAGGQLGDEKSNIEQLKFGALDFSRVSIGPLSEFAPMLNVLQLPYLFRDSAHMWNFANSEIGDEFLRSVEDLGLVGLSWFDAGSRNFYNSEREVKTIEDLKNLKIRVMESELMIDMANALGVNPTPMNSGEVYSSLQSGVIQGAENNIPTYVANAHNEVAMYFTNDEHIRIPEPMLMSKETLNKLTTEDQEIVKAAAKEASDIQRVLWDEYQTEAKNRAIENGAIFTDLSVEEKQKFQDACKPLYVKYAADYQNIVDDITNMK